METDYRSYLWWFGVISNSYIDYIIYHTVGGWNNNYAVQTKVRTTSILYIDHSYILHRYCLIMVFMGFEISLTSHLSWQILTFRSMTAHPIIVLSTTNHSQIRLMFTNLVLHHCRSNSPLPVKFTSKQCDFPWQTLTYQTLAIV